MQELEFLVATLLRFKALSTLSTLKPNAEYILKTFRKKFRFEETLGKVLKQHSQQDRQMTKWLYKHKTIFEYIGTGIQFDYKK